MAESGHHHDHGHGELRDYTGPMILFGILGPLEIVIGLVVGNPIITSIGGHDTGDVVFPLVGLVVTWVSTKAERVRSRHQRWRRLLHGLACQLQVYTALGMGLANIALIGLLPILTAPGSLGSSQAAYGVAAGLLSFAGNGYAARLMRHQRSGHGKQVHSHFRLDMWSAIATVFGSVMTVWTDEIKWAIVAVGVILGLSLTETLPELRTSQQRLHRMARHPADSHPAA